ncbi:MAG: KH domain-containing protein [Ignavibacterium sp.]|nr:MAG: KH domain-containing protein [Ignavibacterium sp.]
MKEFIEYIIKHLVDNPDKLVVKEYTLDDNSMDYKLKVDKSDIGKVIGKKGQNIKSLRTLLSAVSKGKQRTTLDIIDE